jgi:hypothetical protein
MGWELRVNPDLVNATIIATTYGSRTTERVTRFAGTISDALTWVTTSDEAKADPDEDTFDDDQQYRR